VNLWVVVIALGWPPVSLAWAGFCVETGVMPGSSGVRHSSGPLQLLAHPREKHLLPPLAGDLELGCNSQLSAGSGVGMEVGEEAFGC